MKQTLPALPSRLLLACLLLLLACNRYAAEPTGYYLVYPEYRPILTTRAALESAVAVLPAQDMHNTGKIYLLGDYVFVNEKYQGIHVIDNHDPAHPRPAGFLRIPGNVDMAVRGTMLYADSGPDLVAIDISNPAAARPAGRTRDAFPELAMPVAGWLEEACQPANRPAGSVLIGWRKLAPGEAVPVKVNTYSNRGNVLMTATTSTAAGSSVAPSATGKGGSLARFAITGSTLYVVDDQYLRVFNLQNPVQPAVGPVVGVGIGIETIFPQGNYLFLGSQTGMFVYDITTPTSPKYVSTVQHARSCDPVVVDGRFAYVTLRSTTPATSTNTNSTIVSCGSTQTNQLDVVDLTNLSRPQLARSYPMSGPQGLGAENNRLYVCDGVLRVFDTSQAPVLTQVQTVPTPLTDVIPNGQYLLGVGPGGLYQFALGATVQQLSLLPITPGT